MAIEQTTRSVSVSQGWKPIKSAPWRTVIEVRNETMREPCLATRGYTHDGMVHPDRTFFTSVFTPHRFFPTPAGNLVCPTEWREYEPEHASSRHCDDCDYSTADPDVISCPECRGSVG